MRKILIIFTCWMNIVSFVKLNQEIPQFVVLPDPEIYEDENTKALNIRVIVSPVNTSIMLAYLSIGSGGYSDEMKLLNFSTPSSFISSDDVGIIIESKQVTGRLKNEELWNLKIVRCSLIFEKSLHILAKNSLGTVTSRPFRIIRKVLNPFPLVHHESAEFIMGNVGQIVCMIPHSKPSPPNIEFLHDNVPINTTKGGKYKKIYLHPGAMILLIKNLELKDAGSYTCTASFPGIKNFQISDKKTRLTVTTPKKDIKPRFRLSSYDNDRKEEKVIEAIEGSNITLYCLYESTPAAEVTWYYPNSNKKYETDTQFGTLSINSVQLDDASDFSCLANEVQTRSFKLKVLALPRFSSTPLEISYKSHARKVVEMKCEIQNSASSSVIKWFHDGKFVTEKDDTLKFSKNILQIKFLEKKHLGIYQCWLENDGNLWAYGVTVIKDFVELQETESQRENTSIIDKRTAPGLTIHLECSLLQSQKDSKSNFTVKWLRHKDSLELIELTGNKYVMFKKKSEGTVILSIVNPTKNQDEGIYICQLYDQNAGLLHTVRYQLTIDDQKSNEANQFQLKSTEIPSKKNIEPSVSPPDAVRINDYIFGVHIKWNVFPDKKILNVIDHFRVEFQNKTVDKIQQRNLIEERKSDQWSEIFMIDECPTINQITITDQRILKPNIAIRFRVIIFLKVLSPILASDNINLTSIDSLRSAWSNVVEFRNILNCKLSISNKAVTPRAVEIMWTHNCVRESDWQPITFFILYVSMKDCSTSKKCQPDNHLKNFESILIFPEFKDLIQIKTERNDAEFFKANITDLQSKTEYIIGIYGKIVTSMQDVFYIPLSNVINISTLEDREESRTSLEMMPDNDDARNRVIFLILGSLAGVLFVVAAVMFGMCTWYYMKKHMKIHKIHMKPNDSSQPTFLFHYPPSSLSSPLCYGSRINPLSPYQQSLTTNSNLIYYPNQTVGKSPIVSCSGNNQSDLWPLNYYSHSPNTMIMADKFSSDRDSDIDSICNSEKNINSNVRRPIVMGVDQASSTYSRIGSERRFSIGALNMMSNDYPNNFQNMTIPRQSVVPIVFPEPPSEPQPDKYSISYQRTLCPNDIKNQHIDNLDENSASVPFLDKSSSWHNNSMGSLMKINFIESSNNKISADNPWATDTYYDPYSSNSSVGNETNQLVRINP